MKRIILFIVFLSLSLMEIIYAQNKFNFSIGGGYIVSALDTTKLSYWENGYLINFSSEFEINDRISLFFCSSFQKHLFDKNLVTLIVPDVVGYRYSINGENSSVFDFSIGSKLYAASTKIKPYLGVGIGLLLINQGKVEITSWMEGSPNKSTSLFSNTDENYIIGQVNLSLGLEIELINNFQIVLDGKLVIGFGGPTYFPLTASIKFGL